MNCALILLIGSFSKPRRRRRRERHQTKGLMSKTIAMHVRYKSLYISLSSSAKQQGPYAEHDGNGNENVTKQKV